MTDPSAGPRDYRVAVFSHPENVHVLGDILSAVLHEGRTDALIQARHVPGVLPMPVTAAQAEQIVARLGVDGVQAAAVRQETLPDLDAAVVVHHARCLPEGWEIVDLRGARQELIPWERLALVAIGDVPEDVIQRYTDQSRPSVLSTAPLPPSPQPEARSAFGPELWIVCRDPLAAYRLDHRRANYEYLGERKTDSATVNFRLLAEDLVERATRARRTPSTHAYLNHQPRMHYEFAAGEDLRRHVLLHWVVGQRAGS